MKKKLLIVESYSKSKTIQKILGDSFLVISCNGHISDIVPKKNSIQFNKVGKVKAKYYNLKKNESTIKRIKREAENSDIIYLGTDADREGEAISWHLMEAIKKLNYEKKIIHRIVFYEITKKSILSAIENPTTIRTYLVYAQQARRCLDFLFGFNLSPLLWKKIKMGLSAGRVQSPALKLIVERQNEIDKFKPIDYFSIKIEAINLNSSKKEKFDLNLTNYKGREIKKKGIKTENESLSIAKSLKNIILELKKIKESERKTKSPLPFVTSSLQQTAFKKLKFSVKKTMLLAQQLYEGIKIKNKMLGLITYIRTDSFNISETAREGIKSLIKKHYNAHLINEDQKISTNKIKYAQESHECIRPTDIFLLPTDIKEHLNQDQLKLYKLIWERTVCSQMKDSISKKISIIFHSQKDREIECTYDYSYVKFLGYLFLDQDSIKIRNIESNHLKQEKILNGGLVKIETVASVKHKTQPPDFYNEASLIKTMEKFGIGRPSTYASIISTLKDRNYVIDDKKKLKPSSIGILVNKFLLKHFFKYIDYDFTAHLENYLDKVSTGEKEWENVLIEFWAPFIKLVKNVDTKEKKINVKTKIKERCRICNSDLELKFGKSGSFIGCSNYPSCKYTRNIDENFIEKKCPKCFNNLLIKISKYGKFIGCSNYPDCKYVESIKKATDTGKKCPDCGKGNLLKRLSKHKNFFYSCSTYPTCSFISNKNTD